MFTFFYHYNKPQSQRYGRPIISLHYNDACHFVEDLDCQVPAKSKVNPRRQPHFVMRGRASRIRIRNRKAVIT